MTRIRPTSPSGEMPALPMLVPNSFLLTVTTEMDLRGHSLQGHRLIRACHVTLQCIKNGAIKGPKVQNFGSSVETSGHGSSEVVRWYLLAGNVPNYTVPPEALVSFASPTNATQPYFSSSCPPWFICRVFSLIFPLPVSLLYPSEITKMAEFTIQDEQLTGLSGKVIVLTGR